MPTFIEYAPGGAAGVTWVPLDPAWFTDATEDGTLTVLSDFAFPLLNRVTCSFAQSVVKDGLVEGMTKRADPTDLFDLLGTTEARLLNGDDTLLVWIKPTGDQKNGAVFAAGLTNTNAKASLDGGAIGYRGASVASEWRAWAGNASQDDGANVGVPDVGGIFGYIEFANTFSNANSYGYDSGDAAPQNTAMIAGTTLASSTTLRLVIFGGCAFASAVNSDVAADVWFGLRANERAALP